MLRDQILNKVNRKKGKSTDIYLIHHTLMKEYGWIPLEEFKNLPMQTINNLLSEINKQRKAEEKRAKKNRVKKPRKR